MNLPSVPYRAFCSLAGPELTEETDRYLVRTGMLGVILFSNPTGERRAVLPVGTAQFHERFEDVENTEIDGLRALCVLRMADVLAAEERARRERDFARREESLAARELRIAETEARLNEIVSTLAERDIRLDAPKPLPATPPARPIIQQPPIGGTRF